MNEQDNNLFPINEEAQADSKPDEQPSQDLPEIEAEAHAEIAPLETPQTPETGPEASAEVSESFGAEAPREAAPEPASTIEQIKEFSENLSPTRQVVPAAFPFSLLIEGPLTDYDRAKLCDVIARENMGIREVDLEPQFEAGRVLIPRISEFAGILIVQTLRGASVRMRLAPSDQVFATDDTREDNPQLPSQSAITTSYSSETSSHPAEELPVTTADTLPGSSHHRVIDTLTASAALKIAQVEAEKSPEYQDLLEALQRELKYKAYRKGADAIVRLTISLSSLTLPTHYRLVVTGVAVKSQVN